MDERRLAKRQRFSIEPTEDPVEDADSSSPVLDSFVETRGLEVVHALTNFSFSELNTLWASIKPFVTTHWNVGSGRKSPVTGRDMLFMTLVTLKHAGTWDIVAATFNEKAATFGQRVTNFIRTLHPHLLRKFVDEQAVKWTMRNLVASGHQFQNHKAALYAVDVTFQETTMPAVAFGEKKVYFSKKHGLYGHKVEVSVAPNGLAINVTDSAKGSVSDIEIFKDNLGFHTSQLEKQADEGDINDPDALQDRYPTHWAVLSDKGYQESRKRANERLSTDRVIVENFFGRLKTLWGLASDKYTWKKEEYNMYFQTCVALTNVHIRFNPLRNVDGHGYNQYKRRLLSIGGKLKSKKNASKAKYRENRKARIQAAMGRPNNGYASEDYELGYEGDDIFD
ncbi:Aste57867_4809 [Aphanomyces stellatus]|uniref:Aste57867_4809 protein n=1 Tax=Aphanomyces stellatus TaxID=120398 RepID=A0A485KFZ5_9STRA|nr:hypothetical protein As57867_004796 [Aphanomyces stellatus]VFT81903.1 Aste57867_4809 [Aphanomyces stellatus]